MKTVYSFLGALGAMTAGVAITIALAILGQLLLPRWFFVIESGTSVSGLLAYVRLFATAFVLTGASGAVTALLSSARWCGLFLGFAWLGAGLLDSNATHSLSPETIIIVGTLLVAPVVRHAWVGAWRREKKEKRDGIQFELMSYIIGCVVLLGDKVGRPLHRVEGFGVQFGEKCGYVNGEGIVAKVERIERAES
ncbi:MAG: hypothetical protein EOO15_11855 [Chitinophagaceae bacterium]|nr:MAG: hypothetical protein EOO15_11855 [Chitinophagaceae bacterium]